MLVSALLNQGQWKIFLRIKISDNKNSSLNLNLFIYAFILLYFVLHLNGNTVVKV